MYILVAPRDIMAALFLRVYVWLKMVQKIKKERQCEVYYYSYTLR